jgi:hypothetical protein
MKRSTRVYINTGLLFVPVVFAVFAMYVLASPGKDVAGLLLLALMFTINFGMSVMFALRDHEGRLDQLEAQLAGVVRDRL